LAKKYKKYNLKIIKNCGDALNIFSPQFSGVRPQKPLPLNPFPTKILETIFQKRQFLNAFHKKETKSTSKIKVASGGITPGIPCSL
jgi:hypothetical protein